MVLIYSLFKRAIGMALAMIASLLSINAFAEQPQGKQTVHCHVVTFKHGLRTNEYDKSSVNAYLIDDAGKAGGPIQCKNLQCEFEVQADRLYSVLVVVNHVDLAAAVTPIRVSHDEKLDWLSKDVTVEVHALKDFRNLGHLEASIGIVNAIQSRNQSRYKQSLYIPHVEQLKKYDPTRFRNQLAIEHREGDDEVVSGVATGWTKVDSKRGQWSVYGSRDIWVLDGIRRSNISQAVAAKHKDRELRTDQAGRFSLNLTTNQPVYVIVDGQPDENQLALLHEVCPIKEGKFDHSLAICGFKNTDYQAKLLLGLFDDMLVQSTTDEERQQASRLKADTLKVLAQRRKSEPRPVGVLSALHTPDPDADWERVLTAAKRNSHTNYWVITRPERYGVQDGWAKRFQKYSDAQYKGPEGEFSNFRMLGYISLFNENGEKQDEAILRELELWGVGKDRAVSGVFLDNFGRFAPERRRRLYWSIKSLAAKVSGGMDFTVVGAYGSPKEDAEFVQQQDADILCLQKHTGLSAIGLEGVGPRAESILAYSPESHFGVIACNVDGKASQLMVKQLVDAQVDVLCISDFAPKNPQETLYDWGVPLPKYWEELCNQIEDHNKVELAK